MGILWGRWSPLCKSTKPGFVSQAEREETPSSGCNTVTLCGFSVVRSTEGSWGESPRQQRAAESGMSFNAEKSTRRKDRRAQATVSARQRRFGGSVGDRRLHRKPHQTTRGSQTLSIISTCVSCVGAWAFPSMHWEAGFYLDRLCSMTSHFKTDYSNKCAGDSV